MTYTPVPLTFVPLKQGICKLPFLKVLSFDPLTNTYVPNENVEVNSNESMVSVKSHRNPSPNLIS